MRATLATPLLTGGAGRGGRADAEHARARLNLAPAEQRLLEPASSACRPATECWPTLPAPANSGRSDPPSSSARRVARRRSVTIVATAAANDQRRTNEHAPRSLAPRGPRRRGCGIRNGAARPCPGAQAEDHPGGRSGESGTAARCTTHHGGAAVSWTQTMRHDDHRPDDQRQERAAGPSPTLKAAKSSSVARLARGEADPAYNSVRAPQCRRQPGARRASLTPG